MAILALRESPRRSRYPQLSVTTTDSLLSCSSSSIGVTVMVAVAHRPRRARLPASGW
jgi:hypothetical protein